MSRSGYTDYCDDPWVHIRWRGAVTSSIRGKKGQAFLRELLAALDAMPDKRLIDRSFGCEGAHCTLGVIGASRGVQRPVVDDDDNGWREASAALGIPRALAAEIMYENDESWFNDTPETRWMRMRAWVAERIAAPDEIEAEAKP